MSKWNRIENKLPDTGRKVIALSGQDTLLAWVENGEWYIAARMKLGGVRKWMEMPGEPKDFAYWIRQLKEWWGRRKVNIQETSEYLSGWTSRNAQIGSKVVFYRDSTGKVITGLPEKYAAPKGFQKIVCGSVQEAERYSEIQRRQETVENGKTMEEREKIEGAAQKEWRRNATRLMENSRNQFNRDFMEAALRRNAEHRPWEYKRESYLHSEGFEENK
jgi:hypothetical protein